MGHKIKAEHWQEPGYRMQEKEQRVKNLFLQSLRYMMVPPE